MRGFRDIDICGLRLVSFAVFWFWVLDLGFRFLGFLFGPGTVLSLLLSLS